MRDKNIKILHLISSLEKGGAQGLLIDLAQRSDNYRHLIVSFKSGNTYEKITQSKGVEIITLNVRVFNFFSTFIKLLKIIFRFKPNIIQSWMYHADFMTILLKPFIKKATFIWSFHHADPANNNPFSYSIAKVCSKFSSLVPHILIACSSLTKKEHIAFGYDKSKIVVINNGVDQKKFKFKPKKKKSKDVPIIGFIGRWHTIKGHEIFIRAASILSKKINSPKFIMIGTNIDIHNQDLKKILKENNMYKKIDLYGEEVSDIRKYYEMMDIYVCASWSESFSLTLVESALQGIPIVSTDVGIARNIIKDTELISKVGDFKKIANSILRILNFGEKELEIYLNENYKRASEKFTLDRMIIEYEGMYNKLALIESSKRS